MQASPRQPRRRLNRDHAAGAAIAALGLYVAVASGEYPFGSIAEPGPGFLPFALGLILAACGIVVAIGALFVAPARELSFRDLPHAAVILGTLAVAALTIERLGFRSMVLLVLLFFLLVIERRRALIALPLALAVAFGSFYLVNDVLRVPLPVGPWGF
jgi:putative tricarboxylic transport membrane protein